MIACDSGCDCFAGHSCCKEGEAAIFLLVIQNDSTIRSLIDVILL